MLFIAVANGTIRERYIKKHKSELTAHQLSTLMLLVFFTVYIGVGLKQFPPASSSEALLIGGLWVLLTLTFEFGFGRWRGEAWATLLADYNVAAGRLWVLVPAWVAVAPYLFYRLWTQG